MVVEEIINGSGSVVQDAPGLVAQLITEVGRLGKWIQAVGLVVIAWFIFQIVALIVNRKKRKALYKVREDVEILGRKVDKILDRLEDSKGTRKKRKVNGSKKTKKS